MKKIRPEAGNKKSARPQNIYAAQTQAGPGRTGQTAGIWNRKGRKHRQKQQIFIIKSFLQRFTALAVLLWVLFGFVFGIAPMANADMEPSIHAGDVMLYYRLEKTFHIGDAVMVKKDGSEYTARIVAQGGDTVEITAQSELKVNGSIVVENDIFYTTPKYETDITYPLTLDDNEYFLLCDYREGAKDSRYFGPVGRREIKGKIITVLRRSGI